MWLEWQWKEHLTKSTYEKKHFHFVANMELYFSMRDINDINNSPRTRAEVEKLHGGEIRAHENFVFASRGKFVDFVKSRPGNTVEECMQSLQEVTDVI